MPKSQRDQQACAQTSVLPRLVGRQASVHGILQSPCKIPLSIPLQVSGHQGYRSLLRTSGPSLLQEPRAPSRGPGILGNTKTVPAVSGRQFITGNHRNFPHLQYAFPGTLLLNPQKECRAGTSPHSQWPPQIKHCAKDCAI